MWLHCSRVPHSPFTTSPNQPPDGGPFHPQRDCTLTSRRYKSGTRRGFQIDSYQEGLHTHPPRSSHVVSPPLENPFPPSVKVSPSDKWVPTGNWTPAEKRAISKDMISSEKCSPVESEVFTVCCDDPFHTSFDKLHFPDLASEVITQKGLRPWPEETPSNSLGNTPDDVSVGSDFGCLLDYPERHTKMLLSLWEKRRIELCPHENQDEVYNPLCLVFPPPPPVPPFLFTLPSRPTSHLFNIFKSFTSPTHPSPASPILQSSPALSTLHHSISSSSTSTPLYFIPTSSPSPLPVIPSFHPSLFSTDTSELPVLPHTPSGLSTTPSSISSSSSPSSQSPSSQPPLTSLSMPSSASTQDPHFSFLSKFQCLLLSPPPPIPPPPPLHLLPVTVTP